MADPELNLKVTADISALTTAMQRAQSSVASTAAKMQTSFTRLAGSMAQQFDESFANINRGFGRVGKGAQVGLAAASAAAGDLNGTLQNLPGTLGQVASAAKAIFDVVYEYWTGAGEQAKKLEDQLAVLGKQAAFKQETQELQKQMEILKERDPFEKRRLETQRQLAAERARFNALDTEGATPEAQQVLKLREALILEQERIDIVKIRDQVTQEGIRRNEDQRDKEETSLRNQQDFTDSITAKQRELMDLRTKLAIVAQPEDRRRLELEQKLIEIERTRIDAREGVNASFADSIALAEKNLVIAEATAEMEEELGQKRLDLLAEEQAARDRMQGVATVESSFGGSLRVANEAAQRGQTVLNEKQVQLQEEIRNLVRDIATAQRFGGIQ